MLKNWSRISVAAVTVAVLITALVAGCASKPQDPNSPAGSTIGVIDMDKAIKAHPKYADFMRLQQEYNNLAAAAAAAALSPQAAPAALRPTGPDTTAGLAQAAEAEFKGKMTAREAEMNTQIKASADEMQRELGQELDAYSQEVDKEIQPRIFNLQLKLKTVQLSKEDAEALQAELNGLQQDRAAKLTARHKELAAKLNASMAAKQDEAKQQLNDYSQKLHAEIAARLSEQQTVVNTRNVLPPTDNLDGQSDNNQALVFKRQEAAVLQDFISSDIQAKAAKVAVEKGLNLVLSQVRANVCAVDITDAVIAEFNK